MKEVDFHIYHMFPRYLNLYGDRGNILTLCYFAKKLGLNPVVHEVEDVKDIDWNHVDFMLLGGGSDREQLLVTKYLEPIKDRLKEEIEKGLPLLAVCGGYQFLGHFYKDSSGIVMPGLSILDMETIGQNKERMVGNIVVESERFGKIIGFVNHAGETFHKLMPLGKALNGKGNNLSTSDEGVLYKNLIGTYLHGPLLPKNPALTLFFLEKFCERNNITYDKSAIDLSLEEEARNHIIKKILKEG